MAMRITIATARPRTTGTIRALIIDTSCLPNETRKAAVPLPDEPRTLRRAMRGVSGNRRAAGSRQSGADGDGHHEHNHGRRARRRATRRGRARRDAVLYDGDAVPGRAVRG